MKSRMFFKGFQTKPEGRFVEIVQMMWYAFFLKANIGQMVTTNLVKKYSYENAVQNVFIGFTNCFELLFYSEKTNETIQK